MNKFSIKREEEEEENLENKNSMAVVPFVFLLHKSGIVFLSVSVTAFKTNLKTYLFKQYLDQ